MTVTITDNNGNFKILAKQQEIPVMVSCVGYYTATVNYEPGQPLKVNLMPKVEQLKMVTIRAGKGGGSGSSDGDGMTRKDKLALFTDEFIGTSEFAKSCVINNMDDIDLIYNKKTKTLVAICDKPIIIINKKLGYTISYFLDKFEKSPEKLVYMGNYIFRESYDNTNLDSAKIKKNREKVYEGSRLQFIRALWYQNFKNSGYNVYSREIKLLSEKNMLVDSLHQKYMQIDYNVYITNKNNPRASTNLKATNRTTFINQDGYYGTGLQWRGDMGEQRIGDLLPYEFHSEKDPQEFIATQN